MSNEATIDTLAIEIEANAMNSVDGVRKLSRALTSLSKSITSVNSAGISNVSNSLNTMSGAFSNAGTSSNTATSGAKKYTQILPSLISHTNRASNSAKSLAYYFGKFYANMFLVIRGIKTFGKAISGAMDYMEAFNFWDVSITSATAKTSEWQELGYNDAQAYAEAFKQGLVDLNQKMTGFKTDANTGDISVSNIPNLGINLTDLTTYQAEIVSITSSLGLCTQVSSDTSKALSMLAADMSSLKNIDLKTVMTNFQSGLIGQSRALYKYGIDITNATLQTYAYKYGIDKAVSEMTQADKMQLRMLAILDQSKVAWGDLANTLNQPANQFRILKNGVKNLAITIGKILMPAVSAVLPYLNAMVKALQTFFEWVAKAFGIELQVENTGIGTSDIFEDIADSADDATDSVNSLKKSLTQLGIDELNINNPDSGTGTGSSSVGGGVDLSSEISAALAEYEKAWEEAYRNVTDKSTAMADAIVEAFKKKDYKAIGTYISTGITNALNSISWSDVYSLANSFGSGFADFLNGLFTPELFGATGRTIASALNTAIYTQLSFGKAFDWDNLGESIATGINNFFETFDFEASAQSLNVFANGLSEALITAIDTIDWTKIGQSIVDSICSVNWLNMTWDLAGMADSLGKAIVDSILGISVEINEETVLKWLGIDSENNIYKDAVDSFKEDWDKFWDNWSPFAMFERALNKPINFDGFKSIGNFLEDIFSFEWTKQWFEEAKKAFQTAFDGNRNDILDIGCWILEGILDGFVGAFVFIVEPIAHFFEKIDKGIRDIFGIASPAKEMEPIGEYIILGVVEGFNSAKEKITKAIKDWYEKNIKPWFKFDIWNFDGVEKGLSKSFESAISAVKEIWNRFATWLNEKLTWNIDPIVIAGKTLFEGATISLGKIPTFANGGFPEDGLFMANHSELVGQFSNGKTAVANNEQIVSGIKQGVKEAVSEILAPYLQQIAQNTREAADKDMSVNIGDREIAKANERGQRALGAMLITT